MTETFGQKFARLRKEKGLKQEDIAQKVNISSQAVSKWENDITSPDISTLPLLADIFGITIDELLGREVKDIVSLNDETHKDINKMVLKVNIESKDGDKVKLNLPMAIIKICVDGGMSLPQINGNDYLKNIDFKQIISLVEQGVVGKLLEIESADGDTVYITVE